MEFKWDGVRALAFIEAGRLRLMSRTGKDITATYPEVSSQLPPGGTTPRTPRGPVR